MCVTLQKVVFTNGFILFSIRLHFLLPLNYHIIATCYDGWNIIFCREQLSVIGVFMKCRLTVFVIALVIKRTVTFGSQAFLSYRH